jgi:isochorismate synthase
VSARWSPIEPHAPATRFDVYEARCAWAKLVERALSELEAKKLEKVVLARSLVLVGSSDFSAQRALNLLRSRFTACASFLVASDDGGVFLGATPESLCRVKGSALRTEALAGTAKPEDAAALAGRAKESHEHRLVIEGIIAALKPLSDSLEVEGAPRVAVLPNVAHLRTPLRARLRRGTTGVDVLGALHPTPAVGGLPRAPALSFIAEHEGLNRGWYAGAIGWLGSEGADLAVGLRSALLEGKRATLFVGAGIVRGSDPAAEWEETEAKARPMLEALGAAA